MREDVRDELDIINGSIPPKLKWTLTAINRVGFPIMAFLIMTYICYVTLGKNTEAIGRLAIAVERLNDRVNK